jgi:NADH:ubiquinone oxidoreductase subunit C
VTEVLARRDRALNPEETEELLRDRLGDGAVLRSTLEFGVFTVWVAADRWVDAAARCRDESLLAYDMFDCLFAVDARQDGFDVVAVLYSTSTGNRIALRTRCEGGRDAPVCPSLIEVYRGSDWMERETWDMFGIVFEDHPGLEPRILTVENFEGWPLRKDFHLTSRAVKPWPGVKEPAELDEDGNVIERVPRIGDAPGPYELDKAMAEQAKLANPEPVAATVEGAEVAGAAATADVASDSGGVLAGDTEQALETKQKEVSNADAVTAGGQAEGPGLDQDVYDRLIAEGKSERIARSKAKAAFVKAQRAREASGPTAAGAAEAAAAPAGGGEPAAPGAADDQAEPAGDKAERRRREQAEARARKAAERAGEAPLAPEAKHAADADLPSDADSGSKPGTGGPTADSPAEASPRDPSTLERPATGDVGSQASHEVIAPDGEPSDDIAARDTGPGPADRHPEAAESDREDDGDDDEPTDEQRGDGA